MYVIFLLNWLFFVIILNQECVCSYPTIFVAACTTAWLYRKVLRIEVCLYEI